MTANDATLFIITIPDSPPIGNEHTANQQNFISRKSTPKIDKAVRKIKEANADSTKMRQPQSSISRYRNSNSRCNHQGQERRT